MKVVIGLGEWEQVQLFAANETVKITGQQEEKNEQGKESSSALVHTISRLKY